MPLGIKAWTVQALIEFMYKGHVNISQCGLMELVHSAELLKIDGFHDAPNNSDDYFNEKVDRNENSKSDSQKPRKNHFYDMHSYREAVKEGGNSEISSGSDATFATNNLKEMEEEKKFNEDTLLEPKDCAVGKIRVKSYRKLLNKSASTKVEHNQVPDVLNETSQIMTPLHMTAANVDLEAESITCIPNTSYICRSESDTVNYLDETLATDNSITEPSLMCSSKFNKLYHSKYAAGKTITKAKSAKRCRLSCDNNTSHYNTIKTCNEPSIQQVILRNPRSNQPRIYSNEALYNALMSVKHGESIYGASREYQVPRKTLRNWMKRWDIKSQFPMPKQLKDAATKKKLNYLQVSNFH